MQEKNTTIPIFSSRLRAKMQSIPLTQKQLEEASKIRQTSISDYLNGKAIPSADALSRLAAALGVTMDWLWGVAEDPQGAAPGGKRHKRTAKANPDTAETILLRNKLDMATAALETILRKLKK